MNDVESQGHLTRRGCAHRVGNACVGKCQIYLVAVDGSETSIPREKRNGIRNGRGGGIQIQAGADASAGLPHTAGTGPVRPLRGLHSDGPVSASAIMPESPLNINEVNMLSSLVEAANRKGYSGYALCEYVNRRGLRVHINTFRAAVKDGIQRTEHQERIYNLAREVLDELPAVKPEPDDISGRAREAGLTLKSVWGYYNATHDKNYGYVSFLTALRRCQTPYERELVKEAGKIIEILRSKQDG